MTYGALPKVVVVIGNYAVLPYCNLESYKYYVVSGLAQGVVKPGSNVGAPKQGLFGSEKKKKITICFQFSHFQGFVKNNFFCAKHLR